MFEELVLVAARMIEAAGVGTMIIGFLVAVVLALSDLRAHRQVYRKTRQRLGKAILLGLELLVAADILRTISEVPSLYEVAVLAGVIGIRTFLSFVLEVELTGQLPWRGGQHPPQLDGGHS